MQEQKKYNFWLVVVSIVVGYFIAMFIRSQNNSDKNAKKITFLGLVGSYATFRYRYLSGLFAGLGVYELAHDAGFTFLSDSETLGRMRPEAIHKQETIRHQGKTFEVKLSKWLPAYYMNDNYVLKPTFHKIIDQAYAETGLYFIRESNSKEIVYIGMVYTTKDGFHRLYRHFAQDSSQRALNHEPYKINYGDEYEIRIAKINDSTPERLRAIEDYYQNKYKPVDSYREPEIIDVEFEEIHDREVPF